MSDAPGPPSAASDLRLRLRLLVGVGSLGAAWLTTQLRAWDHELHATERAAPRSARRRAPRRLLGALVEVEVAEGRELARLALERTTARALEWISGQAALRRMIAEQSRDLSRSALDEIRDATQEVDGRAESAVHRVVQALRPRRRSRR